MIEQLAIQKTLHEKFAELKTRNSSYTLRSFSRKLGLSSGAVSGILNGKRRISKKLAVRIVDALLLDPQERSEVLKAFSDAKMPNAVEGITEEQRYFQLSIDQFQTISDWHHFALLSLVKTEGFKSNTKWIANRLSISQTTVVTAIERLKRLGMLVESPAGKLTRGAAAYRTSDDVSNLSLRKAHAGNLELARASLETDDVTVRDFSALTMAIDPAKLPRAKELIRKFQDEFAAVLENDPKKEVYKLCIQFFPLTKKGNES